MSKAQRVIKGLSEKEYNTDYMYKYKQVKKVSTEKLLKNKAAYLKKISYIDEEMEKRKLDETSLQQKEEEEKKMKNVSVDFEKMKILYEKIKNIFEN